MAQRDYASELVWGDPPPEADKAPRPASKWQQITDALRDNLGEWALVVEGYNCSSTRASFNQGKLNGSTEGVFETRMLTGEYGSSSRDSKLYIRCVTHPDGRTVLPTEGPA